MAKLYSAHSRALAATFADLESHAIAQGAAPIATPGGIVTRRNARGFGFYAVQRYGFDGRRVESYLAGPVGHPEAERERVAAAAGILDARSAVESIRLLSREGYSTMPPRHYAAVATLANQGLFAAGGLLVGTHAFEAIVNKLAIRSSAFATEDIDIGRVAKLALTEVPEGGLLEMLRLSGIDFVEVPPLDPGEPSIKLKERGRSRFTVDVIVPSPDMQYRTQFVPELRCHASALPYFRYLVAESQPATVICKLGCAAVRVPLPERFALHKLLVAQLRVGRSEKSRKDVRQAATLIAALGDLHPGALEAAFRKTPVSARSRIRASLAQIGDLLSDHPKGLAEMRELTGKK